MATFAGSLAGAAAPAAAQTSSCQNADIFCETLTAAVGQNGTVVGLYSSTSGSITSRTFSYNGTSYEIDSLFQHLNSPHLEFHIELTPTGLSGLAGLVLAIDGHEFTIPNESSTAALWSGVTATVFTAGQDHTVRIYDPSDTTDTAPSFGNAIVDDRTWAIDEQIADLQLPAATGGNHSVTYSLTPDISGDGLTWNAETRTISGTPTRSRAPQTYSWTVVDGDINTEASDEDTITFDIAIPPAKAPTPQVVAGNGAATLRWHEPTDAGITGWQVRYKAGSGNYGNWADLTESGSGTLSGTVTGLANGASYGFQVRAVTAGGGDVAYGAASEEAPVTLPSTPRACQSTDIFCETLTAAVGENGTLVGLYGSTFGSITSRTFNYDGTSYNTNSLFQHLNSPHLEFHIGLTLTGLSGLAGLVLAIDGHEFTIPNESSTAALWSGVTATVFTADQNHTVRIYDPSGAPGAPIGLTATPGGGQVTLRWTPGGDGGSAIVKHRVRRKVSAGIWGNWTDIPDSGAGGANAASHTVGNLTDRTEFSFEVRAVNANGESASSNVASATPLPPVAPPPSQGAGASLAPSRLQERTTASVTLDVEGFGGAPGRTSLFVYAIEDDAPPGPPCTKLVVPSPRGFDMADSVSGLPLELKIGDFDRTTQCRLKVRRGDTVAYAAFTVVAAGAPTDPKPPPELRPSFGAATVPDQGWRAGEAIAPLTLPAASGGNGAPVYSLTSEPAGLAGLSLDPATRTLSGTPSAAGSYVFTWRAHDADANRAESDAAVLTFEAKVESALSGVEDAVQRTLAAVGMRTLGSALANIGARLADTLPGPNLMLAGQSLPLAASGAPIAAAGDATGFCASGGYRRHDPVQAGYGSPGCGGPQTRGVGADALLGASAFSLLLGAAPGEAGADPRAPLWSLWGRGDLGIFEGRLDDGARYRGETRTGWLGLDARSGRWVAGLALSHGTGEADYDLNLDDGTAEKGRLETTLTALYPYGRWTLGDGLELRGVLGAGTGEARHALGEAAEETGDLTMWMASVGLRRELQSVGGVDLAARGDASLVRMEIGDGPETIAGITADSWRLRAGLEASRRLALDEASALTPFAEIVGRVDGGDGLSGTGLEVAGGVRYTAPGVEVEARGRWLAAHTEDGARERGVSVTARVGPGADGRGLSLALSPRWGSGTGAAQALWRHEMPQGPEYAADTGAVDARIGYGVALAPVGLLTPFAEAGLSGDEHRRLRLGARFEASRIAFGAELWGEHRERAAATPEQSVRLDLVLRF